MSETGTGKLEPDLGIYEVEWDSTDDFPCRAPVPAVAHVAVMAEDPHGYIRGTKIGVVVALILFSVVGIAALTVWGR